MIDLDTIDNIKDMAEITGRMFASLIKAGIPTSVAENMVMMYWADQLEEAHK